MPPVPATNAPALGSTSKVSSTSRIASSSSKSAVVASNSGV